MKPAGTAIFACGVMLVGAMLIWGWVGFYASSVPIMLLLGGAGIALMAVGSRLNRGSEPNRAVNWQSMTSTVDEPLTESGETPEVSPDTNQAHQGGNTVTCPNCGKLTRVGAGFCGECGFRLPAAAAPPPPPPPPAATPTLPPPPPPPPPAAAPPPHAQIEGVATGENPFLIGTPPLSAEAGRAAAVGAPSEPELDIDATRISARRKRGALWSIVLESGERYLIDPAVLVGRNASTDARWPDAQLISVDDSTKSVSKTHAAFEADADGVWVTDLNSTNGVAVGQKDGAELDLEPGIRALVAVNSEVLLGDYSLTIERS